MQVFRSEIKVGLLVLISFILFVIGIFVVSDVRSLWDKKKTLTILFHVCGWDNRWIARLVRRI